MSCLNLTEESNSKNKTREKEKKKEKKDEKCFFYLKSIYVYEIEDEARSGAFHSFLLSIHCFYAYSVYPFFFTSSPVSRHFTLCPFITIRSFTKCEANKTNGSFPNPLKEEYTLSIEFFSFFHFFFIFLVAVVWIEHTSEWKRK